MYVGQEKLYRFRCDVCGQSFVEDSEHPGLFGDYINTFFVPDRNLFKVRERHICQDCFSDWRYEEYESHMRAIYKLFEDFFKDDQEDDEDKDDDDAVYVLTDKGRAYLEQMKQRKNYN